jgi:hypothetical protein
MWHTSQGNRTLHGGEALLVASAIDTMVDALSVHLDADLDHDDGLPGGVDLANGDSLADCDSGIAMFDRLDACQRIGLLHQLAVYLLTDTPTTLELTATGDAGVAAVFVEIRDQLAIELDLESVVDVNETALCLDPESLDALERDALELDDDPLYWRRLVCDAVSESVDDSDAADDVPALHSRELSHWEDAIDLMASTILWDRDFEMADALMDQDPLISRQRRRLLGIQQDYFTDVPPDPHPTEAIRLVRETRELVRSIT